MPTTAARRNKPARRSRGAVTTLARDRSCGRSNGLSEWRVRECVWGWRRGELGGSGGSAAGPSLCSLSISSSATCGQSPFVGVGQPGRQLPHRHPGHLGDFEVLVAQLAAGEPHQIVVHRLVHPAAVGDEPVVDAPQRGQHAAADAGLLGDLPDGGLFGGLTQLDVPLGQRPQHPPAPIDAADQRRDLLVARSVEAVDDEPAGGGFVDGAQPFRHASRRAGPAGFGRCRVGGRLAVRLDLGRTRAATTTAPPPAPTWFRLFAIRHPSDSSWHGPVYRRCTPLVATPRPGRRRRLCRIGPMSPPRPASPPGWPRLG